MTRHHTILWRVISPQNKGRFVEDTVVVSTARTGLAKSFRELFNDTHGVGHVRTFELCIHSHRLILSAIFG